MIAININLKETNKEKKLDADLRAIQQINFTGNLIRAEGAAIFFITEEAQETVPDFSKVTVEVLKFYFVFV